jgi:hypothetical protein
MNGGLFAFPTGSAAFPKAAPLPGARLPDLPLFGQLPLPRGDNRSAMS